MHSLYNQGNFLRKSIGKKEDLSLGKGMRYSLYLISLLSIFLGSCALGPTVEEEAETITETDSAPVKINEAAIPTFQTEEVVIAEKPPVEKTTDTVVTPQRKFAFRTPNLIDDLPSEKELDTTPKMKKELDDKVQEATTIRASE